MKKKQVALVHPLTCTKAIEEYHERVCYLINVAWQAREVLISPQLPKEYIDRTIKELGERIAAIRECYGSEED